MEYSEKPTHAPRLLFSKHDYFKFIIAASSSVHQG